MNIISASLLSPCLYLYLSISLSLYIYIYIETQTCKHTEDVIDNLSPYQINNFAHVLYLFQVLSTVQKTCVSCALSVKKTTT